MTTKQTTHAQQHSRVTSFPAASALATVTDLTPQESQAVTQALNPLIADLFALYVNAQGMKNTE